MLARMMLGISLGVLGGAPAWSQPAQAQAVPSASEEEARRFFALLQAGKSAEAVDTIMGSSPLYKQKIGLKEALLGQIDAALGAYGPLISFEKVREERLGTMVRRQLYLAQHRDMVVRWDFHLIRAGSGWLVGHFAFNDQVGTWFADAE